MESLVITPQSKAELKLLADLLKRLHIPSRVLTEEEKEDLGLARMMAEADRSEKVPREQVMAKLRRK